jgi:hypothetical protein
MRKVYADSVCGQVSRSGSEIRGNRCKGHQSGSSVYETFNPDYTPHILAETVVEGDLEEAGNKAFRRLFRYISGDNRSRDKVAMTAPVSQEQKGEKITMTAPVGQRSVQEKWAVSFMMPAS